MAIKFSNAEVPVWKLRAGVVVGWMSQSGNLRYGHIESIDEQYGSSLLLVVKLPTTLLSRYTEEFIWLEPC